MSETTKTSLLSIATLLTGVGGGLLQTQPGWGYTLIGTAVLILILRGYLKRQGIIAARRK